MPVRSVLIIAYAFPPYCRSLGGAIRALKLAEYLQDRGFDVTVLCARSTHFDTFGYDDLLTRLNVQCVDDPMARLASRVTSGAGDTAAASRPADWRHRIKRLAIEWLTPDTAVTILRAFRRAALAWARAHPEGTVITSGPPHSTHLAGRWLRQRFPALRWVVDYRDSWNGTALFRKRNHWLQRLNLRLEALVLRDCDALTYISKPMLTKLLALWPGNLEQKARLVTNGFDAELPAQLQKVAQALASDESDIGGVLRVGYFGAVDDGPNSYRSPTCLFEAVLRQPDLPLRMEFYGPVQISTQWQQRLGDRLHIGGKLSHQQALEKMVGMDALVLLHTHEDGADEVITGKVFEYIATGRPILSIGPPEMAVNDLLSGDSATFSVSHRDVPRIAGLLQRLSAAKAAGGLPVRDASRLERFTRGHQYRTFERLINSTAVNKTVLPGDSGSTCPAAPDEVQLSVCVIGRNEATRLARAAASLRQLDGLGVRWESLFVDSASTDDSLALARGAFDRVIALAVDRRLNAGAARHIGTLQARGTWVLYLDGDMELAPEIVPAIGALVRAGSGAAGLSGITENHYPDGGHEPIRYRGNVDGQDCRLFGGAVLLPRQLVVDAGNWSCGLFAYEESELYARLLRLGVHVRWHEVRLALHHTPRVDARRKLIGNLWPQGSHLGKKFSGAGQVTRLTLGEGHFLAFARLKWEPYLMLGSVLAGLTALPWLGWRALLVPLAGLAFNTVRLGPRGAAHYACWLSQVSFGWFALDRSFRPTVVQAWARQGAAAERPGAAQP